MNILYIGRMSPSCTTYHRAKALERLGHEVIALDPFAQFRKSLSNRYLRAIHYRTAYFFMQGMVKRWLAKELKALKPRRVDLIWIDSGELFGVGPLKVLKSLACPIVLYCVDDLTGNRDFMRFGSAKKALPYYDVCTTPRRYVVDEFYKLGAKKVHFFWRSYDEVVHAPFTSAKDIDDKFRSDVVFVGTWIRHEARDEFLFGLIQRGINVSIWGERWQKSPLWPKIQSNWKGGALSGRDYTAAIQGSKICLGFLSKGNRDLHTRRSAEIPFSGGLFCAERTPEHLEMYKDGLEAVFWNDVEECAEVCDELLKNEDLRGQVLQNGMRKVRSGLLGNEQVCKGIIDAVKYDKY